MEIKIYESNRAISRGQIDPIRRAKNELKDYGYYIVDKDPDIIFLQKESVPEGADIYDVVKEKDKPIIFLDCSASTGTYRFEFLDYSHLISYVKKQLLRDKLLYFHKYPRNRYHYYLIARDKLNDFYYLDSSFEEEYLVSEENLHKLNLGWNLGLMERSGLYVNNDQLIISKNRDIDIHYSVKERHKHKKSGDPDPHYDYHRQLCSYEVDRITNKNNLSISGKCKKDEYLKKMSNSKICVSPWGLGEICHRDWESVTHGSILIKPNMDHLETWPNIYRPWETYIPCRVDFQDLEDKIMLVLNNYKDYYQIAANAFSVLKEAWNNQVFADRFHNLIQEIAYGKN